MLIKTLSVYDFRHFAEAKLNPGPRINVIQGANGSGKTSILEAIYCLGFGRSFRSGQAKQIIRHEQDAFSVAIDFEDDEGEAQRVGFRRDVKGDITIRVNQNDERRLAALARLVPVQLMTPDSIELISGGPKVRRQFLDWGVFHVEQSFYGQWVNYQKVLRQRNSLLKKSRHNEQKVAAQLDYWDFELAKYGEQIQRHREAYLSGFIPELEKACQEFLPQFEFKFELRSGWDQYESLTEGLLKQRQTDFRYGHTTVGPHKADLRLQADAEDVRVLLSRGQMKLLVAALKLVQGQYLQKCTGHQCVYLVDDITAELDAESQQLFCQALSDSQAQVFVSAITTKLFESNFNKTDTKVFHVEHRTIKEL